ncbi:NOL1/NOP2/sun family putative RNA methylase [Melghiribacillus thermohalophilus]|uniref:NOL1/NOP2/sun family putative RNA methylase n=1 Tax=Melghiribacillus thermohalophilus TaxID=1324956 RepID=A0A4R3MY09_9BACI|nr:RsmF rRNA methyltransferase first C-terminal domain-containing protein [Melghiribacillus thermohalophilus]TCT20466.1 NOL1/NOP2/sun family putative RNA methylase [Melghiribacillus thermohalophilus]
MKLPESFKEKMAGLLSRKEYTSFISSLDEKPLKGLRFNPLKMTSGEWEERAPFPLKPVPFCPTGYYVDEEEKPGKHPYHLAGLYYIQEPSAMAPVEVLDPKPGEQILDLSAAPGGKSTQIAGKMKGKGLLVANEIHPKRVKVLVENIERMGITNAIVTSESPENLSQTFTGWFDRILVDAPCSGEGMFRKDPEAREFWSIQHVEKCSITQRKILDHAYAMLKTNGVLVYSTCTFSPEENEQTIEQLLHRYPGLKLESIEKGPGMEDGRPEWSIHQHQSLTYTARIWPQSGIGEGHFIAKLRKTEETTPSSLPVKQARVKKGDLAMFEPFARTCLNMDLSGSLYQVKQQLFMLPEGYPDLKQVNILRGGLHLGTFKKNRFEPAHALAMALREDQVQHTLNLKSDSDHWKPYIRGETMQTDTDHGWTLVTIDGYPLGWGKDVKGVLKNFYPKRLRLLSLK